jgi:hypothetical protein
MNRIRTAELHARLKLQDSKKAKPYVLSTGIHLYVDFTFASATSTNGGLALVA